MSILSRLFQGRAPRANVIWRSGSFPMKVVGESNYQDTLSGICGPHTRNGHNHKTSAIIELEPENLHDNNAVVVKINGRVVGYLPREQAQRVGSQLREEGHSRANCHALIRGGWRTNQYDQGNFGVSLAIPQMGWIDFGTGRTPADVATSKSKKREKTKKPKRSEHGPLLGSV